jgi:ABC-2 type transport system ATP-binding protein
MLLLKNIQKKFGSHLVFNIDNLPLQQGIYWIKGVNGSGKSTLLKLLAGMLPFKGEVLLDNYSVLKHPVEYRKRISYAPAEPSYPSFLTGNELLAFVKKLKSGNDQQTETLKKILGIDNYTANPTGSYSSGMLKKLSLLLAFTGTPEWILLDEPFTTLDQASQLALKELIRQQHAAGASFIITSHHEIDSSNIPFTQIFLMEEKQLKNIG